MLGVFDNVPNLQRVKGLTTVDTELVVVSASNLHRVRGLTTVDTELVVVSASNSESSSDQLSLNKSSSTTSTMYTVNV